MVFILIFFFVSEKCPHIAKCYSSSRFLLDSILIILCLCRCSLVSGRASGVHVKCICYIARAIHWCQSSPRTHTHQTHTFRIKLRSKIDSRSALTIFAYHHCSDVLFIVAYECDTFQFLMPLVTHVLVYNGCVCLSCIQVTNCL